MASHRRETWFDAATSVERRLAVDAHAQDIIEQRLLASFRCVAGALDLDAKPQARTSSSPRVRLRRAGQVPVLQHLRLAAPRPKRRLLLVVSARALAASNRSARMAVRVVCSTL